MEIKVVVIDDGVYKCKEIEQHIEKSLEYDYNANKLIVQNSMVKSSSHGTICALIIKKCFPEARITSLKILDENLNASCEALLSALEWCEKNEVDIINLSLGTTNAKDFTKIFESVERLYQQKKIVIAAINNNFIYTMPASSIFTIGVCAEEYKVDKNKRELLGIDMLGKSQHEIIIDGCSYITPICNSFAAPYISGHIGKKLSTNYLYEMTKIREYLVKRKKVAIMLENGSWVFNDNCLDLLKQLSVIESENVCIYLDCSKKNKLLFEEYFKRENVIVVNICGSKVRRELRRKLAAVLNNSFFVTADENSKEDADYCLCERDNGRIVITSKAGMFKVKKKCAEISYSCNYLIKKIYKD